MSRRICRGRTLLRSEAEEFFREQGARSPLGAFLLSVAVLNVTAVIFSLAAQ
jgi:hypothetical protein